MIAQVKYSQELVNIAETYILNGVCIKARWAKSDNVNGKYIGEAIEKYKNITIQNGDNVDIYCNDKYYRHLNFFMKSVFGAEVKKAYDKGYINIYVKG